MTQPKTSEEIFLIIDNYLKSDTPKDSWHEVIKEERWLPADEAILKSQVEAMVRKILEEIGKYKGNSGNQILIRRIAKENGVDVRQ